MGTIADEGERILNHICPAHARNTRPEMDVGRC